MLYRMTCIQENILILILTIGCIIRTCTFSLCDVFVIITQRLFVSCISTQRDEQYKDY